MNLNENISNLINNSNVDISVNSKTKNDLFTIMIYSYVCWIQLMKRRMRVRVSG